MKKFIALLLSIILVFSMSIIYTGCGEKTPDSEENYNEEKNSDGEGNVSENEKAPYDGSSYGIDLASTELQQMSETRATQEKLTETVREWLEGATMFPEGTEMGKRTYADFVDFIGCDATEYKYDESYSARLYTWISSESDNSKLSVWFKEINGIWSLSFTGSANL